jgi:anti-sigma factor RsiW
MMRTSLFVALRTLLRGGVRRRLLTRRRKWERSTCGGRRAWQRQDLEEGQRGMRWRRMTKRSRWRL